MWKRRECDDKNAMKLDTIESSQIVMRIFFLSRHIKKKTTPQNISTCTGGTAGLAVCRCPHLCSLKTAGSK